VVSCLGSAGFCREVWGTAALFIKKKDHRLCSWVRLDRCGGGTEVGGFCVESSIGPWRLGVWSMETPVVLGFCFVSVDFFLLLQEQFLVGYGFLVKMLLWCETMEIEFLCPCILSKTALDRLSVALPDSQ